MDRMNFLWLLLFVPEWTCSSSNSNSDSKRTDPADRIIKGSFVPSNDLYPSVVKIPGAARYRTCGGTILNKLWVVTAARCSLPKGPTIIAGSPCKVPDPSRQVIGIEKMIKHEQFSASEPWVHDIALLKLEHGLDFSLSTIQPAKLLPRKFRFKPHKYLAAVVGFGTDKLMNPSKSTHLRHVEAPYMDERTCNDSLKKYFGGTKPRWSDCFGFARYSNWEGDGPCNGDYGSPLYGTENGLPPTSVETKEHRLIGIVSNVSCWLDKNTGNRLGVPSLFTGIRYYYDWMDKTLKAEGYPDGIKGMIVPLNTNGSKSIVFSPLVVLIYILLALYSMFNLFT